MSADFVAFDLNNPSFAGALHDPIAALIFCHSPNVDVSVINGKQVIRDGILQTVDLPVLTETHNRLSSELIRSA